MTKRDTMRAAPPRPRRNLKQQLRSYVLYNATLYAYFYSVSCV